MATFDQFVASLEAEFGEAGKGKPFEVFCKWFLENDPEWAKTVDKVWLWEDYPNKWQSQDLGTDLVFRDNEGLIWAVQAKCYSEHRTVTKRDIDSFLADIGRQGVDRGLWLQTTNKLNNNFKSQLTQRDKPVTVFQLNDFREAHIDYPARFAELRNATLKDKPKPDTHQKEAIEAVTKGLATLDRGQLIMACGTGKTFTTLWIKEALEAETTLLLLPSLSLLSQTMREWAWAGNSDFSILNVCSDKSVGKRSKDSEDMLVTDAPFPVTSNVEEIRTFLRNSGPKVLFCTYQSSDLIAQAQADPEVPSFDLAIADEAHRCAGKADAGFATILDGEKIRASKRLFTTATPRYFGASIRDEAQARSLDVVGMDDETVFGPVVHKLSFGQAIEKELLTDYQVVIVGVDEPMVREWIENYEIVATDPDNETDARTLAAKIGLIKAIKDYDLQRVISFHSKVVRAKEFSEELPTIIDLVEPANRPKGRFLANYVSGAMKAGDRKAKIDHLKTLEDYDRGILTNARCLAEGVDVPSLDGVAFIDPKGSQVDIIQAVGRAIRKVRGAKVQKKGTIVLPVFIEEGDDPVASIEASNFKPVWDVLKALRSHDDELAAVLDQCRTDMAKKASKNKEQISDKIIFDLPVAVGAEFSSALRTVLVEASTASWEFWFGLLEQFKEREGHCKVPYDHKEDGYKLGQWASNQRNPLKNISAERKQRLDAIGFVWDTLNEAWEEGFSRLKAFHTREGHFKVPYDHKEDGYKLGQWVVVQRASRDSMSADRKQYLDDLGFVWNTLTEAWEEGFSKLLQFHEREGHCRVPQQFTLDGYKLGTWVSSQRSKKESRSAEQIQRLDQIAFIWDILTDAWDEGFTKLTKFKEQKGHCRVPARFKLDGFKLGQWVNVQRNRQDSMSPERKQRLDDIGFVWDPFAKDWEEGFNNLLKFKEREGHCNVPTSFILDGFRLGTWVGSQRSKKESLSPERKQRLDDIGLIWDPHTEAWEEAYRKLLQFKEQEGHCRVPISLKLDGFKLGGWVGKQRQSKGSLSAERRQRLDAIGFVWNKFEQAWEEGLSSLKAYHAREGHCLVPQGHQEDGFKLGQWVGVQRTAYAKGKMSSERTQRLEALGFVWNANA